MTVIEFNNEFDIQYNTVVGASNPGLDIYEKSVYLTRAQMELVKNKYDGLSNPKRKGFESTEKRRVDLNNLVKQSVITNKEHTIESITDDANFIKLPSSVMFIVQERLQSRYKGCNKFVEVYPTTHDEINHSRENPFKRPSANRALRLDYMSTDPDGSRIVEILYPTNDYDYHVRYVSYPEPIILEDLAIAFPGEDLSIDGKTAPQTCQLSAEMHYEILNRAVELAMVDYKQEGLEAKIQLNSRAE